MDPAAAKDPTFVVNLPKHLRVPTRILSAQEGIPMWRIIASLLTTELKQKGLLKD